MKWQIRNAFFNFLIGSFCLSASFSLVAKEYQEAKITLNDTDDLEADLLDQIENKINLSSVELFTSAMRSRRWCHHSSHSSSILLYQADLTRCGIIDDRAFLGYTGDFALSPGDDDFSCFVLPGGGIQITPLNGFFFTKSIPPLFDFGPASGGVFDHLKFFSESIYAEAPINGSELCTTWVGSGQQLNVESHPFNGAVTDPYADPRLASFCFTSTEPTLGVAFHWVCTNETFYIFVARRPGLESIFGNYAVYTYLIPVYQRDLSLNPLEDIHTFQTAYNREQGTITWKLDGKPVFSINQIGVRLTEQNAFVYNRRGHKKSLQNPDSFKVFDLGGVDTLLDPVGLQSGMALTTFLDFYAPRTSLTRPAFTGADIGLTRLESHLFRSVPDAGIIGLFYNYPHLPPGIPAQFTTNQFDVLGLDAVFLPTIPSIYRLWGQGAILRLFDYKVTIEE